MLIAFNILCNKRKWLISEVIYFTYHLRIITNYMGFEVHSNRTLNMWRSGGKHNFM